MPNPDEIIEACREARAVPASAANCNEFVIAVAAKCRIALSGTAIRSWGLPALPGCSWDTTGEGACGRDKRRVGCRRHDVSGAR